MKIKHTIPALKELTVEWGNQIHILLQTGGDLGGVTATTEVSAQRYGGCRRWTLIRQKQGKTSYEECQKREEWKEVTLVQGKNMSKTCSPALTQALTEKTSLVLAVILNFPSTVP